MKQKVTKEGDKKRKNKKEERRKLGIEEGIKRRGEKNKEKGERNIASIQRQ